MNPVRLVAVAAMVLAAVGASIAAERVHAGTAARADDAPRFTVDPLWPRPLPNHWLLGSATGVAVDSHDHIFVLDLPGSFNPRTEVGASTNPPTGNCCFPAPPVLVFDQAGNLIAHWGGPGNGYDWPAMPTGIAVDADDHVWIAGAGPTDGQVLEFTNTSAFVRQFGKALPADAPPGGALGRGRGRGGYGGGSQGPTPQPPGHSDQMDTFGAAAQVAVDVPGGIAWVADGFRNRRVAVVDLSSGRITRVWSADGGRPDDSDLGAYQPGAAATQFRGASCIHRSRDGLLYVCDRGNDRIRIYSADGTPAGGQAVAPATLGEGSVWDLAFSADPAQRFLYVADGMNDRIAILDRKTLTQLTTFGDGGRYPGGFTALHSVATDSRGNLYTAETYEGKRVQKFVYRGIGPVAHTNQGVLWPR
ncbi:MAG: NHL repeat-containing protein [Gemmatimonadales bacterium]